MALNTHRSRPWLSRLHLALRLIGLTAVLAALVGLALLTVDGWPSSWDDAWQKVRSAAQFSPDSESLETLAALLILVGGSLALLLLLVEVFIASRKSAVRRGASQLNSALQVTLALVLLLGVNVASFLNPARIDCTRDSRFTFAPELREELSKLRGDPTTIVVLLKRGQSAPRTEDKGDNQVAAYEAAAEAVLIEKVRDLADQLRQLSNQRLNVVVLDTHKKEYHSEFNTVTRGRPALARAINAAPESSLIFHTREDREGENVPEHVQRMSFDGFLQLDRSASLRQENLVLLRRGIEPVKNRLINLEERRPRVGIMVPVTLLSTQGSINFFSMKKLREALTRQGFEVRDILLRNEHTREEITASYDEVRVPQLRNSIAALRESLPANRDRLRDYEAMLEELRNPDVKMSEFRRKYDNRIPRGAPTGPALRKFLLDPLPGRIDELKLVIDLDTKQLEKEEEELKKLNEKQARFLARVSDRSGKLELLLADCDLLLIPRYTRVPQGFTLTTSPSQFFRLNEDQLRAVRDFMKAGKPVLACLSPTNEVRDPRTGLPPDRNDGLEKLLAELGIRCSRQTVLYEEQRQGFLQQEEDFQRDRLPTLPGVVFADPDQGGSNNPLGESLRLAGQLSDLTLDIQLAYPRPVTFFPAPGQLGWLGGLPGVGCVGPLQAAVVSQLENPVLPGHRAEFLFTPRGNNWNENFPFPRQPAPGLPPDFPRFQPPASDDPLKGTPDEPRRKPFSLGVAIETTVPWSWHTGKDRPRTPLRVAVVGHGGLFVDETWSPSREKLLLDSCNWLLGRDDLLNRDERQEKPETEWKYPRLDLEKRERSLWQVAALPGLSVLCAFAGVVVLLIRRMS